VRRAAALGALAAAAAPSSAIAAAETERAAGRLYVRAAEKVFAGPPCEARPAITVAEDGPPATEAELPAAFTASFALLLCAPTDRELAAAPGVPPSPLVVEETYRRGTRIVRSDGTVVTVRLHSRATRPEVPAAIVRCLGRLRKEIRRLGRRSRRAVVRRALAVVPALKARREQTGPAVTLSVARGREVGLAAAVTTPEALSRRGMLAAVADGRMSYVAALVPDGVADVSLKYPSTKLTVTASVVGNVATAFVPRPIGKAMPKSVVWRDRAGRVVRTVRR
jgi:hypothetical protein